MRSILLGDPKQGQYVFAAAIKLLALVLGIVLSDHARQLPVLPVPDSEQQRYFTADLPILSYI